MKIRSLKGVRSDKDETFLSYGHVIKLNRRWQMWYIIFDVLERNWM
jgi:hypothetical protein